VQAQKFVFGVLADWDQVGEVRGTVLGQNVLLVLAEPLVNLFEFSGLGCDDLKVVEGLGIGRAKFRDSIGGVERAREESGNKGEQEDGHGRPRSWADKDIERARIVGEGERVWLGRPLPMKLATSRMSVNKSERRDSNSRPLGPKGEFWAAPIYLIVIGFHEPYSVLAFTTTRAANYPH
jgi:hypothetical protein